MNNQMALPDSSLLNSYLLDEVLSGRNKKKQGITDSISIGQRVARRNTKAKGGGGGGNKKGL